jgi:hypothetical protein
VFAFLLLTTSQVSAQNENSELQYKWTSSYGFWDWIDWAYDGEGDWGWVAGAYSLWAKEVVTPSGNKLLQGELRGGDEIWVYDASGMVVEHWTMIDYDNHIFYHYPQKYDGERYLANEPVWATYISDTGQLVRVKWLYHIIGVWDEVQQTYVWDMDETWFKYQSWRFMKPK